MAARDVTIDENEPAAALDRLEKALARLEQAATRPTPAQADLDDLRQRHDAMRTRVAQAMGEIDGLMEELSEGGSAA